MAPDLPLDGRVAVVTGASRGIGRAIAERLAADGAAVAVTYQSRVEAADAVVADIEAAGGRALAVGGDVGDPDDVDALFAAVEAALGAPAILVNNAALHRGGRTHRLAVEDFDLVLRTSTRGAFLCARRALPAMLDAGWGRVITISSPVAVRGYPGDVAYGAAKAAQLGFTRCLAADLARTGVTANAVLPGFVETEMTGALDERSLERIRKTIPAGRPAEAHEIAAGVAYLASPAADYVTGVVLPVDGGITV